jgi:hypothetical protein
MFAVDSNGLYANVERRNDADLPVRDAEIKNNLSMRGNRNPRDAVSISKAHAHYLRKRLRSEK